MPYLGNSPSSGGYHKLDSLTASATDTYALTLGGSAYYPATANQLLVSLNGVIQAPQDSFTISGSNIVFASALSASDSIDFIMSFGDVYGVGTPADGTITDAKIQSMAASKLTGALPAIDGSALTNLPGGGKVLKMSISEITANSTRGSATSFADDLDFGSFTPSATSSTIFIQGVANMDSASSAYVYYKWLIDGSAYLSTTGTTPTQTHAFYSSTSLNDTGFMPSTIMTSVANTDGSAITVKCQGSVSSGTLYINRSAAGNATGSPSSVIFTEVGS